MGLLQLWYIADFINPNKQKKHYPSFYELCKEDAIKYKKQKEAEQKEAEKRERERKKAVAKMLEKQRKEVEAWQKEEEKEYKKHLKYYTEHYTQASRKINDFMTLCLVDGVFTSRGLEIKAYVSFDDRDGDLFTIRAEIRSKASLEYIADGNEFRAEKEVVIEYMNQVFILSQEELDRLCNKKDTKEIEESFERIYA